MSLIIFLLLGAFIGYVASRLLNRKEGFFASMAIGVIGAFIGAFIAHLFNNGQPILELDGGSVVAALIGSLALVAGLNYHERGRIK